MRDGPTVMRGFEFHDVVERTQGKALLGLAAAARRAWPQVAATP